MSETTRAEEENRKEEAAAAKPTQRKTPSCPNCGKSKRRCKCRLSEQVVAATKGGTQEKPDPEDEEFLQESREFRAKKATRTAKLGGREPTDEERTTIEARNPRACLWVKEDEDRIRACPNNRTEESTRCVTHGGKATVPTAAAALAEAEERGTNMAKKNGTKKSASTHVGRTTSRASRPASKAAKTTPRKAADPRGGKCDYCKEVRKTTRTTKEGKRRCMGCWREHKYGKGKKA